MSETQPQVNGVTYSSKGFDLISLGISLREKSIIELLEKQRSWLVQHNYGDNFIKAFAFQEAIALIKGEK
jgi:hypothetical protein